MSIPYHNFLYPSTGWSQKAVYAKVIVSIRNFCALIIIGLA